MKYDIMWLFLAYLGYGKIKEVEIEFENNIEATYHFIRLELKFTIFPSLYFRRHTDRLSVTDIHMHTCILADKNFNANDVNYELFHKVIKLL